MIKNLYLVSLILCVLLLTSCINNNHKQEVLRPVKYIEITSDMAGVSQKTFSGVLQSDISTNLSFQVAGRVNSLNVEEGDYVKKDDVIGTLGNDVYTIEYEDALAYVGEAKSRYVNAKKYYARLAKLYVDGAISDRQLDDAKAEAEASANALKSAEKKSEYAELRLSHTTLKAPMEGYIASVNTEINENVNAGTPVVKLISSQNTEVKINIPESYVNDIKKGEKALIKVVALNNKPFPGVIRDIGVDALSNSSTFPITIDMINSTPEVKSGMSADVIIQFKRACEKCITIPISAVMEDKDGLFVYTLEPVDDNKSKIVRAPVETGGLETSGIEIKSGLQSGDKVVIAGLTKVTPGMLVKTGN